MGSYRQLMVVVVRSLVVPVVVTSKVVIGTTIRVFDELPITF